MTRRVAIGLTLVNLLALMQTLLAQMRPVAAQDVAPVLRGGRALEIVDDRGLIRASITVERSNATDGSVL